MTRSALLLQPASGWQPTAPSPQVRSPAPMSLPLLSLRLSSLLAELQLFGEELVARVQQAVNDARHNKDAALQAHTITIQYAVATPEASAVEGESNISARAGAGALAVHCQSCKRELAREMARQLPWRRSHTGSCPGTTGRTNCSHRQPPQRFVTHYDGAERGDEVVPCLVLLAHPDLHTLVRSGQSCTLGSWNLYRVLYPAAPALLTPTQPQTNH